ncbi:MAG: hypothetical protein HQL15_02905 [Candidatus Omnitrophica bacterium]|nr:hypothetical protein [Candidatus Omnitrophota bacterium]
MIKTLKSSLQIFVGMALAMQLAGCLFVEDDGHRGHRDYHERGHESSLDVRVHS